jgi:hypothetical protein
MTETDTTELTKLANQVANQKLAIALYEAALAGHDFKPLVGEIQRREQAGSWSEEDWRFLMEA